MEGHSVCQQTITDFFGRKPIDTLPDLFIEPPPATTIQKILPGQRENFDQDIIEDERSLPLIIIPGLVSNDPKILLTEHLREIPEELIQDMIDQSDAREPQPIFHIDGFNTSEITDNYEAQRIIPDPSESTETIPTESDIIQEIKKHKAQELLPAIQAPDLQFQYFSEDKQFRLKQLIERTSFLKVKTLREQIEIAIPLLRQAKYGKPFNFRELAIFMHVQNPATIQQQWKKLTDGVKKNGRPSLLSSDMIFWMKATIISRYTAKRPISFPEIIDMVQIKYQITLSLDTLRHIIYGIPELKTVIGNPKDARLVFVSDEDLILWYKTMKILLKRIPAAFVFNMDETGCNEWVDSGKLTVVVPNTYEEDEIDVPVDRHSKRSTLTAAIAADGGVLKPFISVDRHTIDDDLLINGYFSSIVEIVHQENAFMSTYLFDQWANEIFFPSLKYKRLAVGYNGNALLIMDGFSAHESEAFRNNCMKSKVIISYLVPHSSDVTQPLDLITFGGLKLRFRNSTNNSETTVQTDKIVRMMQAWATSTIPHKNVAAFKAAGLIPYINKVDRRVYLRVDLSKSSKLQHLAGLLPPEIVNHIAPTRIPI
jgi:hypothetical protein